MDPKYPVYLTVVVVVAAILFVFMPHRSDVDVVAVSAADSRVTAMFVNKGDPIEFRYWIEFGGTGTRHCPGQVALEVDESKAVEWFCPALAGQTGEFNVMIGPMS